MDRNGSRVVGWLIRMNWCFQTSPWQNSESKSRQHLHENSLPQTATTNQLSITSEVTMRPGYCCCTSCQSFDFKRLRRGMSDVSWIPDPNKKRFRSKIELALWPRNNQQNPIKRSTKEKADGMFTALWRNTSTQHSFNKIWKRCFGGRELERRILIRCSMLLLQYLLHLRQTWLHRRTMQWFCLPQPMDLIARWTWQVGQISRHASQCCKDISGWLIMVALVHVLKGHSESFSLAFMRIEKHQHEVSATTGIGMWYDSTWNCMVGRKWVWIHSAERLEVETWTGQSSQNSRPKTEEQPLKEMTKSLVQKHSRNSYDFDMAESELATPSSKPSWGCAGGSQSWVLKRFHCMFPRISLLQCFYG